MSREQSRKVKNQNLIWQYYLFLDADMHVFNTRGDYFPVSILKRDGFCARHPGDHKVENHFTLRL